MLDCWLNPGRVSSDLDPSPSQLGGLGITVSGVWGRAPAAKNFGALFRLKRKHLVLYKSLFSKTVRLFENRKFLIIANKIILFPVRSGTQPGSPSNSINSQILYPFYFVPNHIAWVSIWIVVYAPRAWSGAESPPRQFWCILDYLRKRLILVLYILAFFMQIIWLKRSHVTFHCIIELAIIPTHYGVFLLLSQGVFNCQDKGYIPLGGLGKTQLGREFIIHFIHLFIH